MKYILNFDFNKITEINKKGMVNYEGLAKKRSARVERAKTAEEIKKIKAEKIDKLVLDTDDILILRYLFTIGNEPKTVRCKDDNSYFWIKLSALLDEYQGLLFLTKTALNARLNKYVDMKLIERKCVRNEDGTFSFFKLTGIVDLIYIPVDSTGKSPVNGQVHMSQVENTQEEIPVDAVIKATGCTEEKAIQALQYSEGKDNQVGYAISAIKGNWNLNKNMTPNKAKNTGLKFSNFTQRDYDYDLLANKLTNGVDCANYIGFNSSSVIDIMGEVS